MITHAYQTFTFNTKVSDFIRNDAVNVETGRERCQSFEHFNRSVSSLSNFKVMRSRPTRSQFGHGLVKRFQHLPNIRSTKVERILGKCWMNGVFKRFQRH